jgi:hypothetical protein
MAIEIICVIIFGVLATALAVATMIQNYTQWRNERRLEKSSLYLTQLLTIDSSHRRAPGTVPTPSSRRTGGR